MKNTKREKHSGAQLVEIICAVCIFAVCAAIIIQLFVGASYAESCSKDMNNAIMIGETLAEKLKASGNMAEQMSIEGFVAENSAFVKYYDSDWNDASAENRMFVASVEMHRQTSGIDEATITIRRIAPYLFVNKSRQTLLTLEYAHYNGGAANE